MALQPSSDTGTSIHVSLVTRGYYYSVSHVDRRYLLRNKKLVKTPAGIKKHVTYVGS